MKHAPFLTFFILMFYFTAAAQSHIKLGYFSKVPANVQKCGALYTYDTTSLTIKKYILLTDFQNLGWIIIEGKQIKLQLADAQTKGKTNISTYKGGGYTITLSSITSGHKGSLDMETGTLQIINGAKKLSINIHGQSGCDDSGEGGN